MRRGHHGNQSSLAAILRMQGVDMVGRGPICTLVLSAIEHSPWKCSLLCRLFFHLAGNIPTLLSIALIWFFTLVGKPAALLVTLEWVPTAQGKQGKCQKKNIPVRENTGNFEILPNYREFCLPKL